MELNFQDKSFIKVFFNSDGYVLNFSNSTFANFTFNSVGVNIQEKYGGSKGKALQAFVDNEPDELVLKLALDLLRYYEDLPDSYHEKTEERNSQAFKLKERLSKYEVSQIAYLNNAAKSLSDYFDSDYIDKQMGIMNEMISLSPADAIGKAKELLESCFKHILDHEKIEYSNSNDIATLQKKVFKFLNLDSNENISAKNNQDVKLVLSGLNQIIKGINSLRNDKGDGHGKGANFIELPPRYASVVVGSALTVVSFVWETYQDKQK